MAETYEFLDYTGLSEYSGYVKAKLIENSVAATATDGATYTATVDGLSALTTGAIITIKPSMTATSTTPTLNVNGLGAKQIRRKLSGGTLTRPQLMYANVVYKDLPVHLMYDGTYWVATQFTKPSATDLYGMVGVENGGTGADTGDEGLKNLLAAGPTILSPNQFGDTLPASASEGQLFLQKYNGTVDELSNTLITGLMQKMYPVGSVYTTNSNINPNTLLGFGSWSLVGKNFSLLSISSDNIFTMASGLTNSLSTKYSVLRTGQTMRLRLGFKIGSALNDNTLNLGNLNLAFLGTAGFSYTYEQCVGVSDGGNAIIIGTLGYGGDLSIIDVVGVDSMSASQAFYFNFTMPILTGNMLDEACDQFHWERTA